MSDELELDEVTVSVSRQFTGQELSLIIEALILSRAHAVRPNFDEVDEATILRAMTEDDPDVDVPMKDMTREEAESLEEMILLFIGGLRVLEIGKREVLEDKVSEISPEMIRDIQEFLKGME